MTITPHIVVQGAERAAAFYHDAFGAEEVERIPTPDGRLMSVQLRIGDGRLHLADEAIELPRIDYRHHNGRPYRYAYGASAVTDSAFLDRLVKIDVEDGSAAGWQEDGTYPGEPVFVPAPGRSAEGRTAEDGGVLLSVVLDAVAGTSFLLVLDASDLNELARARVPHHIPFGFHGQYYPEV